MSHDIQTTESKILSSTVIQIQVTYVLALHTGGPGSISGDVENFHSPLGVDMKSLSYSTLSIFFSIFFFFKETLIFLKFQSLSGLRINLTFFFSPIQAVTPKPCCNLGMTALNPDISATQGLIIEAIITFVLVLTVEAVCDDRRTDIKGSVPVAVGLAITCCHLAAVRHFIRNL